MRLVPVTCISKRENWNELIVGDTYLIDTDSLYMNYEGDTYVDVYDVEVGKGRKWIGILRTSHFTSI
jgi:hypothetical protein